MRGRDVDPMKDTDITSTFRINNSRTRECLKPSLKIRR